jgi:hypothetical protein
MILPAQYGRKSATLASQIRLSTSINTCQLIAMMEIDYKQGKARLGNSPFSPSHTHQPLGPDSFQNFYLRRIIQNNLRVPLVFFDLAGHANFFPQ